MARAALCFRPSLLRSTAIVSPPDIRRDATAATAAGRWASALVGTLFVGVAVAIALLAGHDAGWAAYLVAGIVGALGADALLCALRHRRCLLSRLGPLP